MLDPVRHPAEVLEVYRRHPAVHPYGIADAEQLWDTSRWWRRGDAIVALLALAGDAVVYAVAHDDATAAATLALLAELAPALPDAFVITGPTGLSTRLGRVGLDATWADAYDKLHLPAGAVLPSAADDLLVLGSDDVEEVRALFATDPDAGDFFHPGLLADGLYLGRRRDGRLVAVGGTHVIDRVNGVAAIGNVATHPVHRRQGHARAVVVGLAARLRAEVATVGLNVRHRTSPARRLYGALGFVHAVTYEEASLVRR